MANLTNEAINMKHLKFLGFEYKTTGDVYYLKFMGKFVYLRVAIVHNLLGVNF